MRVTKKQADKFNHAIDEIMAACYNLGLTKVKTPPKMKAGQEFKGGDASFFKFIEDYSCSELASIANELYAEVQDENNRLGNDHRDR